MSKTELLQKLRDLSVLGESDPETAHGEADRCLVGYINDPEVTAAFARIKKWY